MNPTTPQKEFQKLPESKIVSDFFASDAWAKAKIYALAEMTLGLNYSPPMGAPGFVTDNNARLDGARNMLKVLERIAVPEVEAEKPRTLNPV